MVSYSVGTWDANLQAYTPQRGLTVRSFNITLAELRQAIRDLRRLGYEAHRKRASDSHDDNDSSVLIERTDGRYWKDIMKSWRR